MMQTSDTTEREHGGFHRRARALAILTLAAGLLLVGATLAAFLSFGLVYRALWGAHVLAQLGAVGCACMLVTRWARELGREAAFYLIPVVLFLVTTLAQGLLPIISRDALIYHLFVPKLWLEAGRIVEIPWHEWSHFPLLLSIGYAGFLQAGLELLTPWYHCGFLILLASIAGAFIYYKFLDPERALFAWALMLSVPITLRMAAEPMADLAAATYFGLGFVLFFVWGEQRGAMRALLPVGAAFGLATAVKYNSLLACVVWVVAAAYFLARWKYGARAILAAVVSVGGVAFVFWLPWSVKNAVFTGNPVYPFLGTLFGGEGGTPFVGEDSPIVYRLRNYEETPFQWLLIPLRMLLTGEDGSPRLFDGVSTPILAFAVLALFFRGHDGKTPPWIAASWIALVLYLYSSISLFHALMRYQLTLAVPIALLATVGTELMAQFLARKLPYIREPSRSAAARLGLMRGALAAHFILTLVYLRGTTLQSDLWHFLTSDDTHESYLERHLGEYRSIMLVSSGVPADGVVYLLYTGNRYYYYDRQVRGRYFSEEPIVAALSRRAAPEEIVKEFGDRGVQYLAIQNSRLRKALESSLDAKGQEVWSAFVRDYLTLISDTRGVSLWKIEPGGNVPRPSAQSAAR